MRSSAFQVGLIALLGLVGCGGDGTTTQVLVTVRAGTAEQAGAWGSVRLFVDRDVGEDSMPVYDLTTTTWPLEIGVLPRGATTVTVRAQAYASDDGSGDAIAASGAHVEKFKEGRAAKVTLVLGEDRDDGGVDTDGGTDECGGVVSGDCVAVPSYVPASAWHLLYAEGTGDLTTVGGDVWTFDTDTGEIIRNNGEDHVVRSADEDDIGTAGIGYTRVSQTAGPALGVFYVRNVSVAPSSSVEGHGSRAFVMLASGTISIEGSVRVGADGTKGGPGGRDGLTEYRSSQDSLYSSIDGTSHGTPSTPEQARDFGGGGGGGNGGPGGVGGSGSPHTGWETAIVGGAAGTTANDDVLRGGGGGGPGQGYTQVPANMYSAMVGGGGGGAVLWVSANALVVKGLVTAPGAGGQHAPNTGFTGAGGGGGAGGTIVLEAPTVTVQGTLAANGGGGAGGDLHYNAFASVGEMGRDDAGRASGSDANTANLDVAPGAGGDGAAGGDPSGHDGDTGSNPMMVTGGAGGGAGGGPGRIVLRTVGTSAVLKNSALLSPSPDSGIPVLTGRMAVHKLP